MSDHGSSATRTGPIEVVGLGGIGEVQPGDDLAELIAEAAQRQGLVLADGDVVVVTSKVVSKAEGQLLTVTDVEATGHGGTGRRDTGFGGGPDREQVREAAIDAESVREGARRGRTRIVETRPG
nr:coenzyme F420-0:L-glutamate ligase [Micromonospora sp. DSM 115978]